MRKIPHFYLDKNIFTLEDLDWIMMSPAKRFIESTKLWKHYKIMGGTFDFDSDIQSNIRSKRKKS